MQLLNFVELTDFYSKLQCEKATLLLFYNYKENNIAVFQNKDIKNFFSDAGQRQTLNVSRIIKDLKSREIIRSINGARNTYEFVPIHLQSLEREYAKLWLGTGYIESNSEVINESRYSCKRPTIDKLMQQINCCYANHCYDGCAVLMRRLFELLLILVYENCGIEDEIKNGDSYHMLDKIVKNAKDNKTLKLSRNKQKYDVFRNLGNYSAHGLYYVSSQKEIDNVKLDYKAMMDELFQKAGLDN